MLVARPGGLVAARRCWAGCSTKGGGRCRSHRRHRLLAFPCPSVAEGFFSPAGPPAPAQPRNDSLALRSTRLCAGDPHLAGLLAPGASGGGAAIFRHGARTPRARGFGTGLGPACRVTRAALATRTRASCFQTSSGAKQGRQIGADDHAPAPPARRADRDIGPSDERAPRTGPLIVEIYTSIAAYTAGRPAANRLEKCSTGPHRSTAALGGARQAARHGAARPLRRSTAPTRFLSTAAWLRGAAKAGRPCWHPEGFTNRARHGGAGDLRASP